MIAGATLLKGVRLAQRGVPPGFAGKLALGAAASLASTLAAARLVPVERVGPLLPYAVYRAGIAGLVAQRVRRGGRRAARGA